MSTSTSNILLVSGWADTGAALEPLARCLRPAGRVTVLSLRDLAAMPGAEEPASAYARGLAERLRPCDGRRIVIGWSTGGIVALEAASAHPELVDRLVLLGATARFCNTEDYESGQPPWRVEAMTDGLVADAITTLRDFFRLSAYPFDIPDEALDAKARRALALGTEFLRDGLGYLLTADLRAVLGRVKTPALLIHGKKDAVVPWRAGQSVARAIPGAQWHLELGTGHDLPERMPEKMAEIIRAWVRA